MSLPGSGAGRPPVALGHPKGVGLPHVATRDAN